MWVKFKVTYSGARGFFIAGSSYDLPEAQLKKIDPRSYEKTVAPWESQVDKKLVAKLDLAKKLKAAQNDVNVLELEMSSLKSKCDQMQVTKKELAAARVLVKKIEKEIEDVQSEKSKPASDVEAGGLSADAAGSPTNENSEGQDDSAGSGQGDAEVGKKKSVKSVAKKNKKK